MTPEILVVCTGNVCRSPYLERRLQSVVDRTWGSGSVRVCSAGSGALVDFPIDPSSGFLLTRLGIDSEDFRARQLTTEVVSGADLILTSTRSHRGAVARALPKAMHHTFAVADFADLVDRMPDHELPKTHSAPEWIHQITVSAAQRRGLHVPLDVHEADLTDPHSRGPETFELMEQEVERWMPALARALGAERLARV